MQVCDDLEKEYELSKAVQEVNSALSQTADDLELCDSVDFQILPNHWDWRFDQPEQSQPVLQPMTPKTEPNYASFDAAPFVTAGTMTPELAVSSNVVAPKSTSGTSRFVPPISEEDIKQLVKNHENRKIMRNTAWAA